MRASRSLSPGFARRCSSFSSPSRSRLARCCSGSFARRGREIEDGRAGGAEDRALVGGGHEAARPVWRAADRAAAIVGHHDEAREVLVLAAEAVGDPGAKRRMALHDGASVHLEERGGVVVAVAVDRPKEADVVHAAANLGDFLETSMPDLPYFWNL